MKAYILLIFLLGVSDAFKLESLKARKNSFEPYESGFVERLGDGNTTYRSRVDEGGQVRLPGKTSFSPGIKFDEENNTLSFLPGISRMSQVYRFEAEGVAPRLVCPNMVGPKDDGAYYCTDEYHGFCDRRIGSCFCYEGYQGPSCTECKPTHYPNGNNLCSARKLCPSGCSGAGKCDYATGQCACESHRTGDDCSVPICSSIDLLCEACNITSGSCLECRPGYYVNNGGCSSCADFDPRCTRCDAVDGCLTCSDLILNSVKRSGRRRQDSYLPDDESVRQLSRKFEFGSQSPNYFDDSETLHVVANSTSSLGGYSVKCSQGENNILDSSWTCTPLIQSHVVCGNVGTLSFESPSYAVSESSMHGLITVLRTGGGYGTVHVKYALKHVSTTDADATPTARYTSSQSLVFYPGVVALTFRVTIHDDYIAEPDEEFTLELYDVFSEDGTASLGSQSMTTVTIVDDDFWIISANHTDIAVSLNELQADNTLEFSLISQQSSDRNHTPSKDIGEYFLVYAAEPCSDAKGHQCSLLPYEALASRGECISQFDNLHILDCAINLTQNSRDMLNVMIVRRGGLRGEYYGEIVDLEQVGTDSLRPPDISRIDPYLDFIWGRGNLLPMTRDFVSIRWHGGLLCPDTVTEPTLFEFRLFADDHARLSIDGKVIADLWNQDLARDGATGSFTMEPGHIYRIVLDYRQLRGRAHVVLMWKNQTANSFSFIPPEYLVTAEHVRGSPFQMTISSSPVTSSSSFVSGDADRKTVAGDVYSITIHPRDISGNMNFDLDQYTGFQLNAILTNPTQRLLAESEFGSFRRNLAESRLLEGSLRFDQATGEIIASVIPQAAGTYEIHVTYNGEEVQNTPVTIEVLPAVVQGVRCNVSGIGVNPLATHFVGEEYSFGITVRDFFDNVYTQTDVANEIAITLISVNQPPQTVVGSVASLGEGEYTVSYTVSVAGTYQIFATMGCSVEGSSMPCSTIAAAEQMFEFIHSATTAETSYADGDGIEVATSGEPASFVIHARDAYGNPIMDGSGNFTVAIKYDDGTESSFPEACVHTVDDEYTCTYVPEKAQKTAVLSIVDATTGAKIQDGYSFKVDIWDGGCSELTSFAYVKVPTFVAGEPSIVYVQAVDGAGNNKTSGCSSNITVDMDPWTYSVSEFDGLYEVLINISESGQHTLTIFQDGQGISNSPFSVTIVPNVPHFSTSILYGDGLTTGVAGEVLPVFVQLVDRYGNNITSSDANTRVLVEFELSDTEITHSFEAVQSNTGGVMDASWISSWSTWDIPQHLVFTLAEPLGIDVSFYVGVFPLGKRSSSIKRTDQNIFHNSSIENVMSGISSDWSAVWDGLLYVPEDSASRYFRIRCSGGGARMLIDGLEILSMWPYATSSLSEVYRMKSLKPWHTIRVEFQSQKSENAFVSTEWSIDGIQYEKISASSLFRWRKFASYKPAYLPAVSDPARSSGEVPLQYVSGAETVFSVTLRDTFGNRQAHHSDNLVVFGWHVDQHLKVAELPSIYADGMIQGVVIPDVETGEYRVSITPSLSGRFALFLAVNPELDKTGLDRRATLFTMKERSIMGSPFDVVVHSSDCNASLSYQYGPNSAVAEAGARSHMYLQILDTSSNPSESGADIGSIIFRSGGVQVQATQIQYQGDGVYLVLYNLTIAGLWDVAVGMCNNQQWDFSIEVYPSVASGPSCTVEYPSTVDPSVTSLYELVVSSRDRFGNLRDRGGDNFIVKFIVPDSLASSQFAGDPTIDLEDMARYQYGSPLTDIIHKVVDHANGTYSYWFSLYKIYGKIEVVLELALGHTSAVGRYCNVYDHDSPLCVDGAMSGGFFGEYFNEPVPGESAPSFTRIDSKVDFSLVDPHTCATSPIGKPLCDDDVLFAHSQSTRWTGFLKAENSDNYTFHLSNMLDNELISLVVGGNRLKETTKSLKLRGGLLYEIELLASATVSPNRLQLQWFNILGADAPLSVPDIEVNAEISIDSFSSTVYADRNISDEVSAGDVILLDGETFVVLYVDSVEWLVLLDHPFLHPSVNGVTMYRRPRVQIIPSEDLFYGSAAFAQSPIVIVTES